MFNEFTSKHLRTERELKVTPKDGFWICPSCNDKNKEIQDVCSNCGQEVDNGRKETIINYSGGYYKRPYCPDCKLIWGKNSINRVTKCSKCGVYLILEDFNPYTKSILGFLVIGGGCLTFFVKEFPILWFGGFLWGISIIATAFQNWVKIRNLDGDIQEKKINFIFEPIRTFLNRRKFAIIKCLNCNQKLRVPKVKKKLKITCPKCKNTFSVTPTPFLKQIFRP